MALLWYKQQGTTRYEVRSAGSARRLYTNGVFHSQYNPRQPVTGSVWDLLMVPAFFAPERIERILLLGVGGGAVIRQLNHFLQPQQIVGVELDDVHLQVAERYFEVLAPNVQLIQADALQWVKEYRGESFDMIIDDLFSDSGGEPQRVVTADSAWFKTLGKLLAPHGSLVANFASKRELRGCGWFSAAQLKKRYPAAFRLTIPRYENAIGVFLRKPATLATLRENLAMIPALDRQRRSCRLNYTIAAL